MTLPPRTRPRGPDVPVDLAELPASPLAGWWRVSPPRVHEALRNVRYTLITDAAADALIRSGRVLDAWAGIGPRLFFARETDRFVTYDPEVYDQNLDVRVRERSWPLNLGDRLWVALELDGEAAVLDFDTYGWTLVVMGEITTTAEAAVLWCRMTAAQVTRGRAARVDLVSRFTRT